MPNALDLLTRSFRSVRKAIGAELITCNGTDIYALVGLERSVEDFVLGGEGDHRTLTALIISSDLPAPLEKGQTITIRGQDWTLEELEPSPHTTTRLHLRSPAARAPQ